MKVVILITYLLMATFNTHVAAETLELKTVAHVDLSRYIGVWYEIASLPQWFQRNCYGSTAEYSLRDDGDIRVVNRCHKGSLDGPLSEATGKAWSVDPNNAKLKVQFFWPFRGDYWIIELGEDYEYAVVGHPKKKYLWILSRAPQMSELLYQRLVEKIRSVHLYTNLDQLKKTVQKEN